MKNETKIFSSNIVELTNEIANTPIEILIQRGVPEQYVFLLVGMGIYTLRQLLEYNTDKIYQAMGNLHYAGYWLVRKAIMDMGLFFLDDHLSWQTAGISDVIAMIPITELDISSRLRNALIKKGGIAYLGDLLTTDYENIISIQNLGEKSIIELKDYIHSLGFSFPNEELTKKEIKESFKAKGIPMVGEALNLNSRTSGILYKHGIYTLEDLINFGQKVYELIGMGDIKCNDLATALQTKNIQLKPTTILSDNKKAAISPNKTIVEQVKKENKSIETRIDIKEKLLIEYEQLMAERNNLMEREKQLDEKITELLLQLSSLRKEEGSGYGRK